MSDSLKEFLSDLEDPSLYQKYEGVPIFDAHEEVYWVDPKTQEAVPKGTPGAVRKRHVFDRKELERIADENNARWEQGAATPITIGHTNPKEPDETRQPEIVGYAKDYTVGYDSDLKKDVLRADYYIRADRAKKAETYPRTSIELWPADRVIDPIAVIRRTPKRDLPQWVYSRGGILPGVLHFRRAGSYVLRYEMDDHMADTHDMPDLPEEPGAAVEPSHEEKVEQFMRHCFSHPHAKAMVEHYAMDEPAAEEAGAVPPEPEGEPLQNAAACASGTNAVPAGKKPEQHRKPGATAPVQRDEGALHFARMQQEIDALKKAREDAEMSEARSRASQVITSLSAEGYEVNAVRRGEALTKLFFARDQAGVDAEVEDIRKYSRRAPVSSRDRGLPLEPARAGSAGGGRDSRGPISEAQMAQAHAYMKQAGLSGKDGFEKAVAHVVGSGNGKK